MTPILCNLGIISTTLVQDWWLLVTGAEKDYVMGFEFVEDVGFGVVVDGEIGSLRNLRNYNKSS